MPLLAAPALAQERAIRAIVPFAPGGAGDTGARIVGQRMSELLGRSVVVENRAGGNGAIAAQALLSSPPDGSALLFAAFIYGVAPHLQRTSYDPTTDFVPVGQTAVLPTMLTINARGRFATAGAVLAALRAGQRITFGSGGGGTTSHLAAVMFARQAGATAEMVHYRGGAPALQAVLAGDVDMMFDNPQPATFQGLQGGTLRGLLVMQTEPSPQLAGVPTLASLGWGEEFTVQSWQGVFAPKGTQPDIVAPIARALRDAMSDPRVRERFAGLAMEPVGSSAEAFGAFFRNEFARWGRFIAANPITLD
jgi:tripartite-type tricarboxylate transporter receptor subunit TctC